MLFAYKSKNLFMNGAFDFFQRYTSSPLAGTGRYAADRVIYTKGGAGAFGQLVQKSSVVPDVSTTKFPFVSSINISTSTAVGSMLSSYYANISQRIEGYILSNIRGRSVTFSFYAYSAVVGTHAIFFKNIDKTRSYVSTFTINAVNTWERKTVTVKLDTVGTWNLTNGIGLEAGVSIGSGSDFHAPLLNTWLSGDYHSHSSCSNSLTSTSQNFYFTGFQIEEGTEATLFERFGGSYLTELMACLRYAEKTYELDTVLGSAGVILGSISGQGGANVLNTYSYKAVKRVPPTVTTYSIPGTSNNTSTTYTSSDSVGALGITYPSVTSFSYGYSTSWNRCFHAFFDAEL